MTLVSSIADRESALDCDSALILGGTSQKVTTIVQTLKPHFQEVSTAICLPPTDHRNKFCLVVVTDDIAPPPDRRFVKQLRQRFPQAKVLGIFDKFDAGVEIVMRSAGIVFWGSHERFNAHCDKILQTVLHNQAVERPN